MRVIRVASRKSKLAMTQTNWVIEQLKAIEPSFSFEVVPIVTKGDRILDVTLSKVGGKGLFVSEIERVLQTNEADLAVHSMKDVPGELAEGLYLAGVPSREDPRDALISNGASLANLPHGARVGTSSLRRMAQVLRTRPDLQVEPLRGNVDTRLRKLEEGEFDAIILAAAGLKRLGWGDKITELLSPEVCIPAIGQGILGVECREDDGELIRVLRTFTDEATEKAAIAERTLLRELNGSCQVPVAGLCQVNSDGELQLTGLVATPDGTRVCQAMATSQDAEELGRLVARRLLDDGAKEIVDACLASLDS